uniref:Tubulin polyglutamylase TTLL4 n=2 Tax=Lygus hesperus TaxID=30085 RepID=A0A146MB87_LYGHE
MATPYLVPKLPLSKTKNCETCAPNPNKHIYKPLKSCVGGCGFSCNSWCPVCVNQMKHEFRDPINVNSPSILSSPKRRESSPQPPKSINHFTNESPDPVDFLFLEDNGKAPHNGPIKSGSWITVSNSVQEKYLREVEALRGKLRELRGATPRKLPIPPTQSKLKSNHTIIKGPVNYSSGTYLNIDASRSDFDGSIESKLGIEERNADSKRLRQPNDTVVAPVAASPKRLRDQSPSYLQQRPRSCENAPVELVGRASPICLSPLRSPVNKMGTTCVERENGEHYTIRIDRNNEISCSIASSSADNRIGHSAHGISSKIEKPIDIPAHALVTNGSLQKEFTLNHVLAEVKKKRSSSFSAGSSSITDSLLHSPVKLEPLSLPSQTVPNFLETIPAQPVEPSSSAHSLNSVSPSTESLLGYPGDNNYFRLSLFSNIPPYVKFTAHNEKADHELPKAIQKALKWKLSTITPLVVKHTVTNSGFRLVKRTGEWGGVWGRHMKSVCFKTLYDYQKINHLPGTFQIGRKDRLWKNIYKLMSKFGKKEFGFLPRTYVLPQDGKALRQVWDKSSKTKWIVKPPAAARGTGIKVINKWTQIPKKSPVIVQKYISNPYLINGNKFDLRLYVLVTSFHPMKIYLYTNGLVRFASVKYSDEISTLANRYMHLTNYSINKLSNNYAANEDAEACLGHKWTIKSLWTYLEGSVNVDNLWNGLVDLVIKTMISGEAPIVNLSNANLNSRYSAYELFGVDVLLDENLKPWLLEVNISPSLHSTSPLDIAVKGPMVRDILNIAGYHIPDRFNDISKDELSKKLGVKGPLCYDSRMYVPELSMKERNKQSFFREAADRESYLDSILEDLTPDDVRHLVVYEDEITQVGSFQKVFPTPQTHEYFQFFEESRYYNMLFDAWETKYHSNREEGVQLLESKCLEQIHLDVSEVEPRQFTYCPSDHSIKGEELGDGDGDTTSIDSGGTRLVPNDTLNSTPAPNPLPTNPTHL